MVKSDAKTLLQLIQRLLVIWQLILGVDFIRADFEVSKEK